MNEMDTHSLFKCILLKQVLFCLFSMQSNIPKMEKELKGSFKVAEGIWKISVFWLKYKFFMFYIIIYWLITPKSPFYWPMRVKNMFNDK